MIPYEELVQALNELNGHAPARPRQEVQPKASGSLPKAAAAPAKAPSQPAMPAVDLDDDFGAPLPADEYSPLVTDVPEPGEAFEVLTEEPLPPPSEIAGEEAFDILSEAELPPPPADEVASAPGGSYEVLGDQAFSGFFEGDAPMEPISGELADIPTPPPEDEFELDLPPPPPPA
jgi:hypothetical protein